MVDSLCKASKFNNVNVKIAVKSENIDLNPGFCFHNHLLALFSEIFPTVYVQIVAGKRRTSGSRSHRFL